MKNQKVFLKTYIPGEHKDDQDQHMIYGTKSKTLLSRNKNNV